MEAYTPDTFVLTINGTAPECLSGINFSDSSDLVKYFQGDINWESVMVNLQGHRLSITGSGPQGYSELINLKRSKTEVNWTLSSTQGGLSVSGQGYVTSVQRSHDTDQIEGFSAEIIGRLNPT